MVTMSGRSNQAAIPTDPQYYYDAGLRSRSVASLYNFCTANATDSDYDTKVDVC
jgi:hypothetical protein